MLDLSAESRVAYAELASLFNDDPTPTIILNKTDDLYYYNLAGQKFLQHRFIEGVQSVSIDITLFKRLSTTAQKKFFTEEILPSLDISRLLYEVGATCLPFSIQGLSLKRFSLELVRDRNIPNDEVNTTILTCWHDIRNLLGITRNQIEFIRLSNGELSEDTLKRLFKIDEATKTACEIAEKMTQIEDHNLPVQDCNALLKSAAVILAGVIPPELKLFIETSPEPLPVKISQAAFSNALLNLVINAVDAINDKGVIRISNSKQFHTKVGRCVRVQVSDSGCGIDDAKKQEIRAAFNTSKNDTQSHGLGLFSVEQFVTKMAGVMEIDDNIPCGTKVSLFFPSVDSQ